MLIPMIISEDTHLQLCAKKEKTARLKSFNLLIDDKYFFRDQFLIINAAAMFFERFYS